MHSCMQQNCHVYKWIYICTLYLINNFFIQMYVCCFLWCHCHWIEAKHNTVFMICVNSTQGDISQSNTLHCSHYSFGTWACWHWYWTILYSFPSCRMKKEPYEELIKGLIKSAKLVDHSLDPCDDNFIPPRDDTSDKVSWAVWVMIPVTR